MAVNPMLSSGAAGIERSRAAMDEAAHKIAAASAVSDATADVAGGGRLAQALAPESDTDETQDQALVSVTLYARQVQAAAKVVETADATVGFLLDVQA